MSAETSSVRSTGDKAYLRFQKRRRAFWDAHAADGATGPARYYHDRVERRYRFLIPPGSNVIELGCGEGDLLAALEQAV